MKLKGWKFKAALIIGGIMLAAVVFLVSPLFHVEEVIVLGNSRVNDTDILNRLNITNTTNILLLDTTAARRRIMSNLFVSDVDFRRDLPRRLYVTVHERRPSAYVQHAPGTFLVLDDFGRVLEIRSQKREALPLLQGLQFNRVQLGEILEAANETDFVAVVQYTQLLTVHELIHRITHIDVSDPANIRILVDYTEFHMGSGVADADMKVRTIVAVLEQKPDMNLRRGIFRMKTINSDFFFEMLQ